MDLELVHVIRYDLGRDVRDISDQRNACACLLDDYIVFGKERSALVARVVEVGCDYGDRRVSRKFTELI